MKATRLYVDDINIAISQEVSDDDIAYYSVEELEDLVHDELRLLENIIIRTITNFDFTYLNATVELQ